MSKVLVAEDSKVVSEMYNLVLHRFPNCEVHFARNGLEALREVARSSDYNLLILDIAMPYLDGSEVLRHLKNNIQTSRLPVVVVSSIADEQSVAKLKEAGIQAFVSKPWRPDELYKVLSPFLAGK